MKYQSKRKIVEALQWTGENWPEVQKFLARKTYPHTFEYRPEAPRHLQFNTVEGPRLVFPGYFIVRVASHLYELWTPEKFAAQYEPTSVI